MHLISPFAQSAAPQKPAAASVRFGCRFFAYLAAAPYKGQDEFVRQCLTTGGNSMKRQSQLFHDVKGDTTQAAIEPFEGIDEPLTKKTGFGLGSMPFASEKALGSHLPADLFIYKSPYPTWEDNENYDKASEKVARSQPKLVFEHIRETYKDKYKPIFNAENAHPFVQGDWIIMHHGGFPSGIIQALDKVLKQWHAKDPGSPLPKSEVDTELIACYVAARFRQKYGTTHIAHLPTDVVRNDYKAFMGEIIKNPDTTAEKGKVHGNKGTYNLILSDGNRLFATNYSATKELHLGEHRSPNGDEEYLLATDKIQPLAASGLSSISWDTVRKNSVISIERKPDRHGRSHLIYTRTPFLPDLQPEPTEV